jgi:hypothetical protein
MIATQRTENTQLKAINVEVSSARAEYTNAHRLPRLLGASTPKGPTRPVHI